MRRQPSAGAAWLAEPRFPTRVYGHGFTALPFFIVQRTCRLAIENFRVHDRLLWPPRLRLAPRSSRSLGRSTGRAVWPQRSGGQAASFGTENDRSELRSNSRARPQTWALSCLLDHDRSGVPPWLRLWLDASLPRVSQPTCFVLLQSQTLPSRE